MESQEKTRCVPNGAETVAPGANDGRPIIHPAYSRRSFHTILPGSQFPKTQASSEPNPRSFASRYVSNVRLPYFCLKKKADRSQGGSGSNGQPKSKSENRKLSPEILDSLPESRADPEGAPGDGVVCENSSIVQTPELGAGIPEHPGKPAMNAIKSVFYCENGKPSATHSGSEATTATDNHGITPSSSQTRRFATVKNKRTNIQLQNGVNSQVAVHVQPPRKQSNFPTFRNFPVGRFFKFLRPPLQRRNSCPALCISEVAAAASSGDNVSPSEVPIPTRKASPNAHPEALNCRDADATFSHRPTKWTSYLELQPSETEAHGNNSNTSDEEVVGDNCDGSIAEGSLSRTPRPSPPPEFSNDYSQVRQADHEAHHPQEGSSNPEEKTQISSFGVNVRYSCRDPSIRRRAKKTAPPPPPRVSTHPQREQLGIRSTNTRQNEENKLEPKFIRSCTSERNPDTQTIQNPTGTANVCQVFAGYENNENTLNCPQDCSGPEAKYKFEVKILSTASEEKNISPQRLSKVNSSTSSECGTYNLVSNISCNDGEQGSKNVNCCTLENIGESCTDDLPTSSENRHLEVDNNNNNNENSRICSNANGTVVRTNSEGLVTEANEGNIRTSLVKSEQQTKQTAADLPIPCTAVHVLNPSALNELSADDHNNDNNSNTGTQQPPSDGRYVDGSAIFQNSDRYTSGETEYALQNVYCKGEGNCNRISAKEDDVTLTVISKNCVQSSADIPEERQIKVSEVNQVSTSPQTSGFEANLLQNLETNGKRSASDTPASRLASGSTSFATETGSNLNYCTDVLNNSKQTSSGPSNYGTANKQKDLPQLKVVIHSPSEKQISSCSTFQVGCTSSSVTCGYNNENNFDRANNRHSDIPTNYSNIASCNEKSVNFVSVNGSNNFSEVHYCLNRCNSDSNNSLNSSENVNVSGGITVTNKRGDSQLPSQCDNASNLILNRSDNLQKATFRNTEHQQSYCGNEYANQTKKVTQLQVTPDGETTFSESRSNNNLTKDIKGSYEAEKGDCLSSKTANQIQRDTYIKILKSECTKLDYIHTNGNHFFEFEDKIKPEDGFLDVANNNLLTEGNEESDKEKKEGSFMGPTASHEVLELGEISCSSSTTDLSVRDINECYNVKLDAPEEVIVAGFHDFCQTMLSVEEAPLEQLENEEANGNIIHVNMNSDTRIMQNYNGVNKQYLQNGQAQNFCERPYVPSVPTPFVRSQIRANGSARESLKKPTSHAAEEREVSSDKLLEEIQNSKCMEKKMNVDDPAVIKVLRTLDNSFMEVSGNEVNNSDRNWTGMDPKRQANVILEIKNAPPKNSRDDKIQSDNLIEEVLLKDIKKIIQNSVDTNSPPPQTCERGIAVRISNTKAQSHSPNVQVERVKNSETRATIRTNQVSHSGCIEDRYQEKIPQGSDVGSGDQNFPTNASSKSCAMTTQSHGIPNFISPMNNVHNITNYKGLPEEVKKVNTDAGTTGGCAPADPAIISGESKVNPPPTVPLRVSVDSNQGSAGQDIVAFHNRTSPCSVDSGTSSHNQGYFVVVAIDFGTTYSGYAFSFTRDPENIHMMKKWDGGDPGVFNQKTPTTLLLTPEGAFHSFGYSARDYYHDLDSEEAKQWMYFDKFKMALHNNEHLSLETEIKAANGKPMLAVSVFAHALRYFKEQALQELSDQSATKILNEDLRWVVTVPAIWKQPAKQFMRAAAYKAGIASAEFADQLLIALEPEAASIYCRKMRLHHLVPNEVQGQRDSLLMKQDDHSLGQEGPTLGDKGTRYMVVDCGGGTVDITVHEVLDSHGTLKELQRASGGPYGSVGVDMEFEKLLCDIFGADFFQQFKMKRPTGYVDLMIAFEARKRNASPFKDNPLNISLPFSFIDYFKKYKGISVETAIKKSSHKDVRWSQGMLRLEKSAMMHLFTKTVSQIRDHIASIVLIPELNIDYLFLVGGFAESLILQKEIKDAFSPRLKVVIPQGVSLAILKGAVLFGLDPTIVNVRRLRMTYGVGVLNRFIHGIHPPEKLVVKDGIQWCADIFDKFVVTDQSIGVGDVIVRSYTPAKAGQSCSVIHMYCSEKDNVYFITDPGVKRCATLILDLSDNRFIQSREIQTRMMFGDTEIKVSALDVTTGKCVKSEVDFLGH